MNIRAANADDVPHVLPMVHGICSLHEQLDPAKYGLRDDPRARYDNWLTARTRDPRSVFLVAEHPEGKLVGFLVATIEPEIPIYRLEQYGFIHDMWVEPQYRHEGVGRRMVMVAIERFRAAGVRQVRCDTAVANEPAQALFRNCGFRPAIVEMLLEL